VGRRPTVLSRPTAARCDDRPVRWRIAVVSVLGVGLLTATVLVFAAFDRDSHSVSDTVRPFVIVMAPVWLVALLLGWWLIRPLVVRRD
jgi:hypothetical protein